MVSTYLHTLSHFSRDSRLYLLTSAIMGFTFWGGMAAVLANLYLLRLGYGPEFIGLFNACGGLGFAAFALPAGALGHRWGSRRTMIFGLCVSVLGGALIPLAESAPEVLRDGWLLVGHTTLTAGFSFYSVNGNPFLVAATSPQERNHAFSVSAALFPLCAFAGSLTAGLMPGFFASMMGVSTADPAPYRLPLFIAASLIILAVLAMLATRPAAETKMEQIVGGSGRAPLMLIAMLALSVAMRTPAEGSARTFFNVYLDVSLQVPTAMIGTLIAFGQLLSVPMALAAPLLMARFGVGRTYMLGSLGAALALLPLALIPHWGFAGLGFAGILASVSLSFPSINVFAMSVVPLIWRSTVSGAMALATGVSFMALAFGGGYVIAGLGFPTLFIASSCLAVASTVVFWSYFRVPRGELAGASA